MPGMCEGLNDASTPWRDVDEMQLLHEMRRGVNGAFTEFFRRFSPLLITMARRRQVPADDRQGFVTEYLEDAVIAIVTRNRSVPTSFAPYLAAGFRRRLVSAWRAREARERRHGALSCDETRSRERVVAEGLSAYSIGAAHGAEPSDAPNDSADVDPIREARLALAAALYEAMDAEERGIMGHVAERFPQREIAGVLGIAPGAARVRILRLRARLRRVAIAYIGALPVDEGIALARFLETPRGQRAKPVVPLQSGDGHDTVRSRHE